MNKTIRTLTFAIVSAGLIAMLQSFNTKEHNYLITASMSQTGVNAGMEILKQGGTAMDAALSVALSEIAATQGKHISYAGLMNLVYYEAKTGKLHNMNASFNTILNEMDPLSIPAPAIDFNDTLKAMADGRSILVPGFMRGVEEAHKKFGKIPFEQLFDHAIEVADSGILWSQEDSTHFFLWKDILTRYPETKAIFTKPDGGYYKVGDTFKQPALAQTLRAVSTKGADYIYKGEWAKDFVAAATSIGSKITMQDMENYEVIWSEPAHGNYKGNDVYVHGAPSFGGGRLIECLNIAELTNLSDMGHYAESAFAMKTLFEISKATLYSSNAPDYFDDSIDLSYESRLKKETSKQIWDVWTSNNQIENIEIDNSGNEHTSVIVATDRYGNMVSLVHTINALNWGSNGLFVGGISIPDPASTQQQLVQNAGPGNRLSENTLPGIVMKNGKPRLGFGCIGHGLQNQTFASLIDVLDFNMTPKESVETPSVGLMIISEGDFCIRIEANKFSDGLISGANKYGVNFMEHPVLFGFFWTGISSDEKTGELSGTEVWLK